ncbi:MAG TPA: MotA/TolQ/ExbB proton channel family protein [Terrimicrobiaceae bacterium]|nr:MotA/TolQ/ExbB proton channel family protein [Terrimicrobiaceae bacterium]
MKKVNPSLVRALASLALLVALPGAFAQEGSSDSASPAAESHTILETIAGGGPLIILIWVAILATSIVMVTFIIQLFLSLRDEQLAPKALVDSLQATIRAGNYQEAWEICRANKAYIARVLKGALERIGRGKDAVENALIEHGLREAQVLRTKNSYLSVVGVVAPMIGLLGTVIGMMGAFAVLGASGVSDPRALALRIGEVLMATASGLFIAIPAFIFYYYFRNRSTIVLVNADDKLNYLVEEIPFEELAGIKIGENFEAGAGAPSGALSSSRKVSVALTTNCPICNGTIQPGQSPCPHCGASLEWA